ncbi:MAG: BMP family ABC transporter substrate-binding protein [Candidatus Limnocylindrales bacterium]
MRIRALGLAIVFAFSIVVTACGGATADIKKIGLVTDVGTLEDKSFNEAAWTGTQAGAKDLGGTASNIVTKNAADYAANIKTFVDQGYGTIVTVGFAMGDATTIAAKQYPKVKFIGVDQGVCVDETGKGDPTFACKGDAKTLLPNYQGLVFKEDQVGYLAGVLAASVSKSGVIGTVGGINTIPAVPRYINGYRNGAVAVNPDIDVKVVYVATDINKAFSDPGTGKSIAAQMMGQKADVIFQVAGLSGAGAIEAACATPGVIGIGVDVDQSKSLPGDVSCVLTSAEKKEVSAVEAAIKKLGAKTDVGGTTVWDASTDPVGVGLSPYQGDYASLVTPEIQKAIDDALAGMKAGTIDPCKPTPCDKKD